MRQHFVSADSDATSAVAAASFCVIWEYKQMFESNNYKRVAKEKTHGSVKASESWFSQTGTS